MRHHRATVMIARERMENGLREAEQARLIRAARGAGKSEGWLLPVTAFLGNLLAPFPNVFKQRVVCFVNPSALGC